MTDKMIARADARRLRAQIEHLHRELHDWPMTVDRRAEKHIELTELRCELLATVEVAQ